MRWKKVAGFQSYSVSDEGQVRNDRTGRIISQKETKSGYLRVMLHRCGEAKNFRVHRLVAAAFIPNVDNKPQVNHKDGDKRNNCVENLEWVTASENHLHRCRELGKLPTHKQVRVRCVETGNVYESVKDASMDVGGCFNNISKVLHGVRKTAGGYHWEVVL